LELTYYFTSNFTLFLRQQKVQTLRKLILNGIKFDNENNLANLENLSIKNSLGNPFGKGKNNFHNLQRLELEDNEIELNRIVLKAKCESLKFFRIKEEELSIEVKEKFNLLLNFDAIRVKLEVLILPFNIELYLLPNLKNFIVKAKYLRHIEIIRSENYSTEKQKDIADAIKSITKEASRTLNFHPKVTIILPTNVSGKARADSANYVTKKQLIKVQSNDSRNTGIMIQLPFPAGFSVNKSNILNTIPIHKDIDGLTTDSVGNLFDLNKGIKPATPLGICSIFNYYNIPTESKYIVIMGKGKLVGQPLACMLMSPLYNAMITICDIYMENIKTITKSTDILIVTISKAFYVNDGFVKPSVTVIDAEINRLPQNVNENLNIIGDVDHSAYEKCKYYTPVPKGVGLLTVASLAFNSVNVSILQHGLLSLNLSQIIRQSYSVKKTKAVKKENKKS
ncbi:13797_t:CDS:2, partial [Gigaspora margarita]